MFNALFSRLKAHPKDKPLPALDLRRAVAALMVRLAKSDAHYAFEEIAEIDSILARMQGLNPVEAAQLRAEAERIDAAAPGTEAFIAEVQAHIPYTDRVSLYDALWDVGLADHALRPQEEAFLAEMARAMGIEEGDVTDVATRHGGAA